MGTELISVCKKRQLFST